MSTQLHVTVNDPDDPMGMPAFDGPVTDAPARLDVGIYLTTDGGFLVVRTDGTAAALDERGHVLFDTDAAR